MASPQLVPAIERWSPFRRVLAASVLDEAGARAALRAARLPLAPSARVSVLHVVPPLSMRSPRVSPGEARRETERLAAAATVAAAAAGNRDVGVASLVSEGWPATEIVRAAWQGRSELVVVGPPATRFDGSSRAKIFRVMRRADLPLLVTRKDPARDYRRVLCAVDRSVAAVDTIALAARLAGPVARSFVLLHVYQVPFEQWIGPDAPDLESEAMAYVRALANAVADDVTVTRTLVRRGERGMQIVRAATEERADLVVIGTHGRSAVSRAILGSTAEWVIVSAPCDVAVARPHRFSPERQSWAQR